MSDAAPPLPATVGMWVQSLDGDRDADGAVRRVAAPGAVGVITHVQPDPRVGVPVAHLHYPWSGVQVLLDPHELADRDQYRLITVDPATLTRLVGALSDCALCTGQIANADTAIRRVAAILADAGVVTPLDAPKR